jgi:hypothetical protein
MVGLVHVLHQLRQQKVEFYQMTLIYENAHQPYSLLL